MEFECLKSKRLIFYISYAKHHIIILTIITNNNKTSFDGSDLFMLRDANNKTQTKGKNNLHIAINMLSGNCQYSNAQSFYLFLGIWFP